MLPARGEAGVRAQEKPAGCAPSPTQPQSRQGGVAALEALLKDDVI